ncbi:MAG: hypothetical protein RI924_919 [Bacteroidota bacterium]
MKRVYTFKAKYLRAFLWMIAFWFMNHSSLFAQKKAFIHQNIRAKEAFVVDGLAQDWQLDTLNFNKQSKLAYAIGNTDSTLFFLLKSTDLSDLGRLLRGGIRIGINAKGEKKVKQELIFPVLQGRIMRPAQPGGRSREQTQKAINEELTKLNMLQIGGFDQLLDGKIARKNEFGIQAAARLDEAGFLVCEYALPMKLLQIDAAKNGNFAVQIRINGLNLNTNIQNNTVNVPAGLNPIGRSFPQRLPGMEGFEPSEFWIISRLAPTTR